MSATAVVIKLLLEDPEVQADPFPIVIPQAATLPCLVVTAIHEDQLVYLEKAYGTFQARVSVACHAATPDEVDALGETVKRCLENTINRKLDDGTVATIWKAGSDVFDYADDRTVFRRVIDWNVRWWRADA